MEKRTIRLSSRYHVNNTLTQIDDHKWVLNTDAETLRVGRKSTEDKTIMFIDPEGGPFMSVNHVIDEIDETIASIDFVEDTGYVITTK
jgi:hypothetical protein